MNYNLALPFYQSSLKYPESSAICADGKDLSYRIVWSKVCAAREWLTRGGVAPSRVAILASRSAEACIGILAAASVGATYVPMNLSLPTAGLVEMLIRSSADAVILDRNGANLLCPDLLDACPSQILALHDYAAESLPRNIARLPLDDSQMSESPPVEVGPESPAYIMFTSGSTGVPKGVVIPARGVHHLLQSLDERYALRPDDRVAETSAASFDISTYNMFAAWGAGASLHILPQHTIGLSRFIQDQRISVWFSVPSAAAFMARMGQLRPGSLPSLRQTFFCGEPLFERTAHAWQEAACFSTISNMYGPTEATVMCMGEDYVPGCRMTRDWLAIGTPYPGMDAAVIRNDGLWAQPEQHGELLLSGPQVALGYLDNPQRTRESFIHVDGKLWYRTGDLAAKDSAGIFHYLGRVDNQVKVRGYRVELEEVEYHLRDITESDAVAAVAWPLQDGTAWGLVGFLSGFGGSSAEVLAAMRLRLPSYMVPARLHLLEAMPRNSNGKVNRDELRTLLRQDLSAQPQPA